VHADEKLMAFIEHESAIRGRDLSLYVKKAQKISRTMNEREEARTKLVCLPQPQRRGLRFLIMVIVCLSQATVYAPPIPYSPPNIPGGGGSGITWWRFLLMMGMGLIIISLFCLAVIVTLIVIELLFRFVRWIFSDREP
jgi:uncharacterized membrane protein